MFLPLEHASEFGGHDDVQLEYGYGRDSPTTGQYHRSDTDLIWLGSVRIVEVRPGPQVGRIWYTKVGRDS